ncbi:Surfeit locus protein 1 [Hibiscus syriacus]|uniref:SURF1-like protein n=1 Tax=Hibiscus syriacus TaxID=106335 RepID=A0A6A2WIE8_HIBSY|nr:surfeit locus protein 1-like [Hibiscus syriacus]KAE8658618.1 Surfeit locus protein 1 [Hibiscus syriacus]
MASNLRSKTAIVSKALTRPLPGGAFYAVSTQSLSPKHWVPSYSFYISTSSDTAAAAAAAAASSSSQSLHDKEKGSKWTRWFLFLPGAITFGLGTWQIFRRQDKIKVLDYRQKRLKMEPLKLNGMPPSSEILETLEFRRVVCKGVFDNGRSIYIGPRSRSISGVTENGYYVITPLMPIPGDAESVQSPVLVNRGWVPRSWRDKSFEVSQDREKSSSMDAIPVQQNEQSWWRMFQSKKQKTVEDEAPAITSVEVTGVVRGSEKPSIFVPANDPNSGQWFYVDVPAIAVACGLPKDTLLIEDINENVSASDPYPVPKDVNSLIRSSVMPQDHLNYTFTWYSLSAAVTFMAFKRLRPKNGRR